MTAFLKKEKLMTASGLYPRVFSNLPFILRLTALNLIGNISPMSLGTVTSLSGKHSSCCHLQE